MKISIRCMMIAESHMPQCCLLQWSVSAGRRCYMIKMNRRAVSLQVTTNLFGKDERTRPLCFKFLIGPIVMLTLQPSRTFHSFGPVLSGLVLIHESEQRYASSTQFV
eukprot:GHVN01072796.1.p1 GENE.GHVN01072796.1~~GHVN01072796.1.p1  ORF type:complete len:107 (+),score=2.17 GHVN01072796.1:30-350(+)